MGVGPSSLVHFWKGLLFTLCAALSHTAQGFRLLLGDFLLGLWCSRNEKGYSALG